MSAIQWIQYNEPVVGENSPSFSDVVNRPLNQVMEASGFPSYTTSFNGFVALTPGFLQAGNITLNGAIVVGTDVSGPPAGLRVNNEILTMGTSAAYFQAYLSSGGTDSKTWDIFHQTGGIIFRAVNDAYSAATAYMQIIRGSGYTISAVWFPNSPVAVGNVGGGVPAGGSALTVYTSGAVSSNSQIVSIADSASGGGIATNIAAWSCSASLDPAVVCVRTRGTYASPTAVQTGDVLGTFSVGAQYDATQGHIASTAGFLFYAAENFTSSAQGSYVKLFLTQPTTSVVTAYYRWDYNAYYLNAAGTATLGTSASPWSQVFSMATANVLPSNNFVAYGVTVAPTFAGVRIDGTFSSPTAVQVGDFLANFVGEGQYDTTVGHVAPTGSFAIIAAENYSGTNQGSLARVYLTPIGSTSSSTAAYFEFGTTYFKTTSSPPVTLGQTTSPWGQVFSIATSNVSPANNYVAYGVTVAPTFAGVRIDGTFTSPTAVQAGDFLSNFVAQGQYDTTVGHVASGGSLAFLAINNWSGSDHSTEAQMFLTPTGSTSAAAYFVWTSGAFYPATGVTLGTTTSPWGAVYIQPGTSSGVAKATGCLFESNNCTTTNSSTATLAGGSNGGSFQLKANSLANQGDSVRIVFNGQSVGATGTVTLFVTDGTNSITIVNAATLSLNGAFEMEVYLTRRDATHVDVSGSYSTYNSGVVPNIALALDQALTLTSAVTIDFQGSVAGGGTLTGALCQVFIEAQ